MNNEELKTTVKKYGFDVIECLAGFILEHPDDIHSFFFLTANDTVVISNSVSQMVLDICNKDLLRINETDTGLNFLLNVEGYYFIYLNFDLQ